MPFTHTFASRIKVEAAAEKSTLESCRAEEGRARSLSGDHASVLLSRLPVSATAPAVLLACHSRGQEGADVFRASGRDGCKTESARAHVGQAPTIGFCPQDILVGHILALSRATGCPQAIPPGTLENF